MEDIKQMGSELDELSKAVENKKLDALKQNAELFKSEIIEKEEASKHKMPEVVFKDLFLEHFKEIAEGKQVSDDTLTAAWIGLAGSPYNEMDIVDEKGDTLYTVPSVLSRPKLDEKFYSSVSFTDMAAKYQEKSNYLEAEGTRYLNSAVKSMEGTISSSQPLGGARWNAIFNRYDTNKLKDSVKHRVDDVEDDPGIVYDDE